MTNIRNGIVERASVGGASTTPFTTSTYAGLPAVSSNSGKNYQVTDIGTGGSLWYSNGTIWKPQSGIVNLFTTTTQVNTNAVINDVTLATYTLPAGIMGVSGLLRMRMNWHANTTGARNVFAKIQFGGATAINVMAVSVNGANSGCSLFEIFNNNSASSQGYDGFDSNTNTSANHISSGVTPLTVNTANAVTINFIGNVANVADTFWLDSATIDLVLN